MKVEYLGLKEINGPLAVIEGVAGASFEELVEMTYTTGGEVRTKTGRIIEINGDRAVIQLFEGTTGLSLTNTKTRLTGKSMEIPLSEEILGRVFDGAGRPIDNMGAIYPEVTADINGSPINPFRGNIPETIYKPACRPLTGWLR